VSFALPHHDEHTGRAILLRDALVDGAYYVGRCRNASVARWCAARGSFFHWREKFSRIYVEEIKHPVDELVYDVFRVVRERTDPKFEIPFDIKALFWGRVKDLSEHSPEMWSRETSVP